MFTNGAVPSFFLAVAIASNGSIAMAGSSAGKPATQASSASKAAPAARFVSWVDPFDEPSPPVKSGARPAAAAPAKPGATTAAPVKPGTRPAAAAPVKPGARPAAVAPVKPGATTAAPVKPGATAATPAKLEVAAAAPPAQGLPSKELEVFMKAFEGRWKCSTNFPAGSLGTGSQPISARTDLSIKKEFGGFSWHGEFKLAKTAITSATSGVFQIGYAAGSKQATFLSYDSVGSAMMGAGTLGGDSVTFAEEGFLKGAKVRVRETLAAKGPGKLSHKFEIEQGHGYQVIAEDTCIK
jgi:hypothetical protein